MLAYFLGEICFSISILLVHKALWRYYVLSNKSSRNSKFCLCGCDDNDNAARCDVRCCCHLKKYNVWEIRSHKHKVQRLFIFTCISVGGGDNIRCFCYPCHDDACLLSPQHIFLREYQKGIPKTHFLHVGIAHSSVLMI